MLVNME